MSAVTIWTLDWVPNGPRGFVRDLRLRWACEEAQLPYTIRTVPFEGRETNHLDHQPFGQVPYLSDGELEIFESGACLLHLARKSPILMPKDAAGAAATEQWVIAALNSVELVTVPWWFLNLTQTSSEAFTDWAAKRLGQIERILAKRDWLVGDRFTVADLLLADVLRIPQLSHFGNRPASTAYVARMVARPAFKRALADQNDLFARGDAARSAEGAAT